MVESVLRTFEDVHICGLFHDPDDLLQQLASTGASRPTIEIAFITAYDHYGVDAFETEALDYLLKSITNDRLRKTLKRFIKRSKKEQIEVSRNNNGDMAVAERAAELYLSGYLSEVRSNNNEY